jgi:hypothetical protein
MTFDVGTHRVAAVAAGWFALPLLLGKPGEHQ